MTAAPPTVVVAATRNPDKLRPLAGVIGGRFRLVPLPVGIAVEEPDPAELPTDDPSVDTLVAIAAAKATAASRRMPGQLVIASDGGLLIPALGVRWSPSRTRRFAGPDATNADRIAALLALTADLCGDDRRTSWREAVAIARDGRLLLTAAAGSAPGWLASEPPEEMSSSQGFWLPALWRSGPEPDSPLGVADGHWARLAALVGPALAGSTQTPGDHPLVP